MSKTQWGACVFSRRLKVTWAQNLNAFMQIRYTNKLSMHKAFFFSKYGSFPDFLNRVDSSKFSEMLHTITTPDKVFTH